MPSRAIDSITVHFSRNIYPDTTGAPFTVVRHLKEEGVASALPIAIRRNSPVSHSASPDLRRRRQVRFQFGFSCGAIVTLEIFAATVANIRQLERD